jgi:hypothetical protein
MDPREQLLQNLMQQLESYELPERYDQAQKDQIMKGRKGQAEIDEGRRAISENERAYQDAITARKSLSDQVQSVQNELSTAQETQQANSPYEQTRQALLFGAPLAAGVPFGIWKGTASTASAKNVLGERANKLTELAKDVRSGDVPRGDANRTARSMGLLKTRPGSGPLVAGGALMATGALHRAGAPYLAESEMGQDVNRAFGGFEAGIGTGLVGQQLVGGRNVPPYASASDVATITGKGPEGETNRLLRGQPQAAPALPPQQPAPAAAQPQPGPAMRHSDRLKQTVTAAGAKPGKNKTANVDAIKRNLSADNMPDVAESLNLPRTANRSTILQRLREISKVGGRYVWPVTAGLVAYDAVTGDAEASNQPEVEAGTGNVSDGGVTNADRMRGAVTGTAAGGAVYGGNRLLQAIPQSVKTAFSAGAPMLAPQMGADMTDYTPEETNQMRNWTARNMPAVSQFVGGYPEEAYDMAQVPEKNPARVYENAYRPGGQPGTHTMPDGSPMADSAMQGQPEQDDFSVQMEELQQLLMQVERQSGPQRRPMPQMPSAPVMAPDQQNRLLQGAMAR